MPNTGNFDPAKAVQGIRQQRVAEEARKQREEAEKQRARAQEDLRRANILKLLRYADEQLEDIRPPFVSEFVISEEWWTREPYKINEKNLRADQKVISIEESFLSILSGRTLRVATRHQRQTRYYGSWLLLGRMVDEGSDWSPDTHYISGLVKLCRPRAGYAYVSMGGLDLRNVWVTLS